MAVVTIHEAKTRLSKLLAALVGIERPRERMFGAFKDRFDVPPDAFFFDLLPEEELRLWEGGDDENCLTPRSGSSISKRSGSTLSMP